MEEGKPDMCRTCVYFEGKKALDKGDTPPHIDTPCYECCHYIILKSFYKERVG